MADGNQRFYLKDIADLLGSECINVTPPIRNRLKKTLVLSIDASEHFALGYNRDKHSWLIGVPTRYMETFRAIPWMGLAVPEKGTGIYLLFPAHNVPGARLVALKIQMRRQRCALLRQANIAYLVGLPPGKYTGEGKRVPMDVQIINGLYWEKK